MRERTRRWMSHWRFSWWSWLAGRWPKRWMPSFQRRYPGHLTKKQAGRFQNYVRTYARVLGEVRGPGGRKLPSAAELKECERFPSCFRPLEEEGE